MRNMPPAENDYSQADIRDSSRAGLENLLVAVIVVAALYFGRDVFVPLALAILLSFALSPLVFILHRWRFNRVLSVVTVVAFAFTLIISASALIGSQIANFAENLPRYQTNITEKIHSIRASASSSGVIGRSLKFLSDVGHEMNNPTETPGQAVPATPVVQSMGVPSATPSVVEIRQADPTPLQLIGQVIAPLLQPLATAVIVIIFVVFFLLQQEDLRDRFIRLAGTRDLQRTTRALHDGAGRLSRYLLSQVAVNTGLGMCVGAGLWFIGLPNPLLWGALATLLRFVPYIGPVIAGCLPAALAIAVDPGWVMLVWVIGLFVLVEAAAAMLEPWFYGHSTGLSGVAIVVAAAFWTLLWGPIGLLLSTPLTMCLLVLGRHVTNFQFLEVIFGTRPALAPEENFYQCVLVNDPDEAARQAETFLKAHSLEVYYDDVALKGLALAQLDVSRGVLDYARQIRIKEAVNWVIDDLSGHEYFDPPLKAAGEVVIPPLRVVLSAPEVAPAGQEMNVLCVAGRSALDEAAAAMLAQLLKNRGFGARIISPEGVSTENLPQLPITGVQIICLSYLEPGSLSHPRYLIRRLRRKLPKVTIIDGFWALTPQEVEERNTLSITGADLIATTLQEAIGQIVGIAEDMSAADAATDAPLTTEAPGIH